MSRVYSRGCGQEQADEKTYAIEQSEKKIAELTAEIDELKAETL